jgi:hypothetical protein
MIAVVCVLASPLETWLILPYVEIYLTGPYVGVYVGVERSYEWGFRSVGRSVIQHNPSTRLVDTSGDHFGGSTEHGIAHGAAPDFDDDAGAGLLAVISWDAVFPDRRDVMVLSPLPMPPHTILCAKVTTSAAVLSLAVLRYGYCIAPGPREDSTLSSNLCGLMVHDDRCKRIPLRFGTRGAGTYCAAAPALALSAAFLAPSTRGFRALPRDPFPSARVL